MANEASFNHPFKALAGVLGDFWEPLERGQPHGGYYKVNLMTRNFGHKNFEHVRVEFSRVDGKDGVFFTAHRHGKPLQKKCIMVAALPALNGHYALWSDSHSHGNKSGCGWTDLALLIQREAELECYVPLLWAAGGDGVQRGQLQVKKLK